MEAQNETELQNPSHGHRYYCRDCLKRSYLLFGSLGDTQVDMCDCEYGSKVYPDCNPDSMSKDYGREGYADYNEQLSGERA